MGHGGGMDEAPFAADLVRSIRQGDLASLERLLARDPGTAVKPLGGAHGTRTPLHVVADWPGFWPNGPEVVTMLISAGADPDARQPTPGAETPLHWAASSDDADVARALIDGGADVDVPDGSIGTPLENAVGYGCWNVAHLLAARGARVDRLWVASALGDLDRLRALLDAEPSPDNDAVSQAFWHACNAGQRRAAEHLLGRGADRNWTPPYARGTPLDAVSQLGAQRDNLLAWLREQGAQPAQPDDSAGTPTS
jgi:uncharacterized protein